MRAGSDVTIGALSAHNFGLIALFTSIGSQLRQLDECGSRERRSSSPVITSSRVRRDLPTPSSASRDRLPELSGLSTRIIFDATFSIQNQCSSPA